MEIDSLKEKFVTTGHYITERYCTEPSCKFGCKHDGHYVRSLAEKEYNCRFGNVQKQRSCKRYNCISHNNCPVQLRIYFKEHKVYSTIATMEHSHEIHIEQRGIQAVWKQEVDKLIEFDMKPTQIFQRLNQLANSSMQEYAHLSPSLDQIIWRKKFVRASTSTTQSDNQSSSNCIPVRINNNIGFILSCKTLQNMSDVELIEVHFYKPNEPDEREVKLIAVSECRKGIEDFAIWVEEALTPNKRRKVDSS
jgi:hypothetical protein